MASESAQTEAVDKFYKQVFENGDASVIDEVVASDFALNDTGLFGDISGPDGAKKVLSTFSGGFSDRTITIDDRIVKDDKIVDHFTMSATHDGEFMKIPATGATVECDGVLTHRVTDGKITKTTLKWDPRALLKPIGATDLLTDTVSKSVDEATGGLL